MKLSGTTTATTNPEALAAQSGGQADAHAAAAPEEQAKSCSCCARQIQQADATDSGAPASGQSRMRGVQEVRVTVRGGYTPATVELVRGIPARLVFERQEASGCSAELLIPGLGIRRTLAPHAETLVEFTPAEVGTLPFTCGMRMLRGELVVS